MTTLDLKKLYEKQISLTEWFAAIGYGDIEAFRKEDNEKRERLKVLHSVIGIPFDAPTQFAASDVATQTPAFKEFLQAHADELCALRLMPHDPNLPKLRMRGHTVQSVLSWFHEQVIDPGMYKADFVPHTESYLWSTIFVVNEHGVFGEIVPGSHAQLTQGFHETAQPITFVYDWHNWQLSIDVPGAREHLQDIVGRLKVDTATQDELATLVNATFAHDHITGYFETVTSTEFGLWFIDYNRILGEAYRDVVGAMPQDGGDQGMIRGMVGSPGIATGVVRIVNIIDTSVVFNDGDVLVCHMTTPEYVPLMKKAAAIVTDVGGILCHAAIVARELKIPCVVGTKVATAILKEGDVVEVDANNGFVKHI